MSGNKSEVQCCMASHMEWHLPVQEEADWLRLFLFENKVGNIAKKAKLMHSTNHVHFYPTPAKLGSARPNTDCLAASNGVCTRETPPGLSCCCSKTKSIITSRHDHLST